MKRRIIAALAAIAATVMLAACSGHSKADVGLSDNVSYFVQQIKSKDVSVDHYRVIFRPSVLVPDIQIGG